LSLCIIARISFYLADGFTPVHLFCEILNHLKTTFPSIERITTYSRSKTVSRKTVEELQDLKRAGISRIHIGLETGYDPLLQFIKKGVTAQEHIEAGKKVKASGISLSEYVILGLGGKEMWREHAVETAKVLNQINPDFIRVPPPNPLAKDPMVTLVPDEALKKIDRGNFDLVLTDLKMPQTDGLELITEIAKSKPEIQWRTALGALRRGLCL
jgi:radical SAM superfamily enzyme YgiQ (UPF0313 family)